MVSEYPSYWFSEELLLGSFAKFESCLTLSLISYFLLILAIISSIEQKEWAKAAGSVFYSSSETSLSETIVSEIALGSSYTKLSINSFYINFSSLSYFASSSPTATI